MLYYKCCYFFNQGVKIVKKVNIIKRILLFVIVLTGTLVLVACKKGELKTPYGSVDDAVYLSGDGYQVTKKELYDEMKVAGISQLERMFYEILFQEELTAIKENPEDYKEDLIKAANKAIFGTDEVDDIKELDADLLTRTINEYVDSMYLLGVTITNSDIDTTDFTDHNESVLNYYHLDVARKAYAKEKLEEEVVDEDSAAYIDKGKDIQSYFQANIEKRYPLSAITIRFTNSYEANQTLRHFNLKAYRSNWYELPNPRADVVDGYALEVLENLSLEGKNGSLSESEHQLYYDSYVINPDRLPTEHADMVLSLDETLVKFLEIYNFIYPYKTQYDINTYSTLTTILEDDTLVNDDEDNLGAFTRLYKDFHQASLRTALYDTLSTKEGETRFTSSPRSHGNYYFLMFKLEDHNQDLLAQLDDEKKLIVWENEEDEVLKDYAEEYYNKLVESKLTDSYISSKASERLDETKIVIYDEEIYLNISMYYGPYSLAKKPSTTVVAKMDDIDILVDDYYEKLESRLGVSVAMDIGLRKAFLASEYAQKITAEQKKEFRENVENLIKQFGQNAFAQSGYPATMGRKNFLRLAFKSNSIDEAVTKLYIANEIEKLYLEDYENHYGLDIYEKFTYFANKSRDQYFSITASHLLIYVDMDEDDSADDPEDFFETLTPVQQLEYKNLVLELMQLIHDQASRYATFANGLEAIVNEYNDATKFRPDTCDAEENAEYKPECRWAKFKKAGLYLKFESLGSTTNQKNYPESSQHFDEAFYSSLIKLYNEIKEEYYDVDKKFPSQILDTRPVSYETVLQSGFGWHLILATGGKVAESAKYTEENDSKARDDDEYMIYEHILVKDRLENEYYLNAYSETDQLSVNQVRIYLNEIDSEYGLESIPTKIKPALEAYLAPIKTRYENSYTRLHLLYKFLVSTNFRYTDSSKDAKLAQILLINKNQFMSYSIDNDLFSDVFGDWFDIFN